MLLESVTTLKGVGGKTAEDLEGMNIQTIQDLLLYFPYRYDVHEVQPLAELIHEDTVTIQGTVVYEPMVTYYGRKKSRLTFTITVDQVAIKAVMFNRAFAKKKIRPGDLVTLTGKWDAHRLQITVSKFTVGQLQNQQEIQPIYSVKGNMKPYRLKKLIRETFTQYGRQLPDLLPETYLTDYKLPTSRQAVHALHFPQSRVALKHARRRVVYEEFLLFQLKMQLLRKIHREATEGNAQQYDEEKVRSFINEFSFQLTRAQDQVLEEILKDMRSDYRMNRLLQGDVGSGKTAVAAICLYAAITAGKQGALMVPTEILAEQHFQSLIELFGDRAQIVLLTGSVKGKKRKKLLEKVRMNEADIVIGTHALIQDDVFFNDLGLVIVDEQHRFGVEQRRTLREKGLNPDVLFMTATPIPRTLAITAFGDMDVSMIDELPGGRKEIKTYWAKENMLERILLFIQKNVAAGQQAYIICPLIEESDKLDIQNAVDLYHELEQFYPTDVKVGLMHGRLSADEKEEIMRQYAANEIQVLVSTTVVEVGVNVPNATIMVIYDAERFGLSQLHQLRGRVGRGDQQSYCILIADPKGEVGKERMRIMTETTNGFELSEQDLKLRGPGDFFGRKQSGMPEFKIADMIHDYRALETARKDATHIVESGLLVNDKAYFPLKEFVMQDPAFTEKLD